MYKKIVILGHTGFIGSKLKQYFEQKHSEIELKAYSIGSLDLTDRSQVAQFKTVFDEQTTVVVCAAIKKQLGDNFDTFSQNLEMTKNLCRVLEQNPVKKLVYFSSAAVYGEDIHNNHITEKTPVNPRSFYGLAKFTAERLFSKVLENKSKLLILRPALIYGTGDQSKSYGPSGFVDSAIKKKTVLLWGDGTEKREFIFLDDIIKITHDLTFSNSEGIVNIASGKSYTFIDIINVISELLNYKLEINTQDRTKDKVDNEFDNYLLSSLLPGFKFTKLEEGIKEMIKQELKSE